MSAVGESRRFEEIRHYQTRCTKYHDAHTSPAPPKPARSAGMTKTKQNKSPKKRDICFSNITVTENGKRRPLNQVEKDNLIAMLIQKERQDALDIARLVPRGSFIERVLKFFDASDVSYALPLFQLMSLASSFLTQRGATLNISGHKAKRPILWTISLAASGSSKTLALDTVENILIPPHGAVTVRKLPAPGSDAQWILDLADENGAFWCQDEVGQFFQNVLKSKQFERIKPWILDAYSNKPISNRLKGEKDKLTIADPHFIFMGMSVRETWKLNVDAASMLDGFCQRFNYVIAPARQDTDMFDHFLYFRGDHIPAVQAKLRRDWEALCAQEGALDSYCLEDDVLPYLEGWWRNLRDRWGDGAVPASFVRRIGYSILSYLVILHFLLGLSKRPIGVETAEIATKYAEFHMESAFIMMREYGNAEKDHVQRVAEIRSRLRGDGSGSVTARDVQRRLSSAQRKSLSTEMTRQILETLDRLETPPDLFENTFTTRHEKSELLFDRYQDVLKTERQREQWRNEKRLRDVRDRYETIFAHDGATNDNHSSGSSAKTTGGDVLDLNKHKRRRAS